MGGGEERVDGGNTLIVVRIRGSIFKPGQEFRCKTVGNIWPMRIEEYKEPKGEVEKDTLWSEADLKPLLYFGLAG